MAIYKRLKYAALAWNQSNHMWAICSYVPFKITFRDQEWKSNQQNFPASCHSITHHSYVLWIHWHKSSWQVYNLTYTIMDDATWYPKVHEMRLLLCVILTVWPLIRCSRHALYASGVWDHKRKITQQWQQDSDQINPPFVIGVFNESLYIFGFTSITLRLSFTLSVCWSQWGIKQRQKKEGIFHRYMLSI